MEDTISILIRIWPLTLGMVAVVSTVAVALYRISTHSRVLFGQSGELLFSTKKECKDIERRIMEDLAASRQRLSEDEAAYLRSIDHQRICDGARMQTREDIRNMRDEMVKHVAEQIDRVLRDMNGMMETHSRLIIEAIRKNGNGNSPKNS